jgi:hypothetical protein
MGQTNRERHKNGFPAVFPPAILVQSKEEKNKACSPSRHIGTRRWHGLVSTASHNGFQSGKDRDD